MRQRETCIPNVPWWLPPVLLLVLGLALVPPADAQPGPGAATDIVAEYIERTDELILWAGDLVAETESGTARSVLRQAESMNRQAANSLGQGQARQASNAARRARAAVWHAVKLAREAMGTQERLRVRAERFGELHLHLAERARDAGHEGAMEMLRKAERQAHRAREHYLQGDLRMAEQMFTRAEDLTTMAARLLVQTGDPEQLRRELQRVEDRIEGLRARLGPDLPQRARRDLGEAEEALERARKHLAGGEPGRALQMIGLARRLADRAGNGDLHGGTPEAVERQLERFDERLAALQEALVDRDDPQLRQLANRAREHRERAVADRDRGAHEEALRQIRAAHDLLEQAERMVR
jgi:hypothetical protein